MNVANMFSVRTCFLLGYIVFSLAYGLGSGFSKRSETRTIADYIGSPGNPPTVGPPGIPGPIGATGPDGIPGRRGYDGGTGAIGATGAVGATGMAGKTGCRSKRATRDGETDDVDYCTVTWKRSKFSNIKSFSRNLTRFDVSECLDECLRAFECVYVDVQCLSSSSCVCWLHNTPDDMDDQNIVEGIASYKKNALCSKMSPARGPRGPPGPRGIRGQTGWIGVPGALGPTGDTGDTGYTGFTGGDKNMGYTRMPGQTVTTGFIYWWQLRGTQFSWDDENKGSTRMPGQMVGKRSLNRILKRSATDSDRIDYCVMSWKTLVNIAFKSSYRNIEENSLQRCLDQCKISLGCLAVDVQTNSEGASYSCWLHNSPQDEEDLSNVGGKNSYIRQLACSRTMPANGPMGPPGPRGFYGKNGASGATGDTGVPGWFGYIGERGSTGPTDSTDC